VSSARAEMAASMLVLRGRCTRTDWKDSVGAMDLKRQGIFGAEVSRAAP